MKRYFLLIKVCVCMVLTPIWLFAQIPTAVVDFEGKGINQTEASALTDRLRSELFKIGTFQVIERGLMEEILAEQGFQQSGCTSDECVVEIGKLIGVQQIIGGSISKVGAVFSINARLISVETGEILQIVTVDYEGEIGGLLKEGMVNVALQLSGKEIIPTEKGFSSLYINSEPSGAEIWIDENKVEGKTSFLIEKIPTGQHEVYLEKNDLSITQKFNLLPEEIKRINLILKIPTGGIAIISEPLEAQVYIKGKEKGFTPLTIGDLPIGKYQIKIHKTGYVDEIQPIIVNKNQIEKLNVRLAKLPEISIISKPLKANILINGKNMGTTPQEGIRLDPGLYEVTISHEDYKVYNRTVELIPDSSMILKANLVRKSGILNLTSNPSGAEVIIEGETMGKTPLNIDNIPTNEYPVKVTLNGYLTDKAMLTVFEDNTTFHHFELASIDSIKSLINDYQKRWKMWLGIAGGFGLSGGYFQYSSNRHYQDYKVAKENAGDLHKTIDRENAIYPIGYGLGGVSLIPVAYYYFKEQMLRNKLSPKE